MVRIDKARDDCSAVRAEFLDARIALAELLQRANRRDAVALDRDRRILEDPAARKLGRVRDDVPPSNQLARHALPLFALVCPVRRARRKGYGKRSRVTLRSTCGAGDR